MPLITLSTSRKLDAIDEDLYYSKKKSRKNLFRMHTLGMHLK